MISEDTLSSLERPEQYNFRFLGKVQVKGRQATVPIYEVYDGDTEQVIDLKHETKTLFEEGLNYYFAREFRLFDISRDVGYQISTRL